MPFPLNPFELHGPGFLAFYVLFAVAVFVGVRAWIRIVEARQASAPPQLTDPYMLAFLRGGRKAALQVTAISLIDRGLLSAGEDSMKTIGQKREFARRPIERAVIEAFDSRGDLSQLFKAPQVDAPCAKYEASLAGSGLVADIGMRSRRLLPVGLGIIALIGVSLAKGEIALAQGRHNLGFLIILTLLSCAGLIWEYSRLRTLQGDRALEDLRTLFSRLKDNGAAIRSGGESSDIAFLTAVFGIESLSESEFPTIRKLFGKKADVGSGGCGSSSCGSSSCGGGCGGGCGGCGG